MFAINKNAIIFSIASVVIIFGFLYLVFTSSNKPTANKTPVQVTKTLRKNDHIVWSKDKKILLVEYSDFQCTNCKLWSEFFNQLDKSQEPNDKKIREKITFIFRNFPLTTIHNNALSAAHAAEAAGLQNKYFEMNSLIFSKQEEWSDLKNPTDYFVNLAKTLKLDTKKFKIDMQSKQIKDRVEEDVKSGKQANINSTASFYLNGIYLDNLRSTQDLTKILLKEINK
ncbi:MAG: thioredoxin domain-containing protein [bacterium]